MKRITLKILASDIRETDYMDTHDCAITRALARAGYPHLIDFADSIVEKDFQHENKPTNVSINEEQYNKLYDVVCGMYLTKRFKTFKDAKASIFGDEVLQIRNRNLKITLDSKYLKN